MFVTGSIMAAAREITSRAFASLADFVTASSAQLAPGGVWMAMKGQTPDAEIAAHLAEALWASGDRTAAERLLREASAKTPENETLQKTLQRLKL